MPAAFWDYVESFTFACVIFLNITDIGTFENLLGKQLLTSEDELSPYGF